MSTTAPTSSAAPRLWHGYAAALATVVIWAGFILVSRLGGKTG